MLTCLVGPPARVAAATAAAQAGAALVQPVGHQPWNGSSLWTVIHVVSSQHLFVQTDREAAATLSLFILESTFWVKIQRINSELIKLIK